MRHILVSACLAAFSCFAVERSATAADAETPTHVEMKPINFPLGNEGRLETIAMNRDGELIAEFSPRTQPYDERVVAQIKAALAD